MECEVVPVAEADVGSAMSLFVPVSEGIVVVEEVTAVALAADRGSEGADSDGDSSSMVKE
jgi:hypothetical protein